jgi:hypothetical protein
MEVIYMTLQTRCILITITTAGMIVTAFNKGMQKLAEVVNNSNNN